MDDHCKNVSIQFQIVMNLTTLSLEGIKSIKYRSPSKLAGQKHWQLKNSLKYLHNSSLDQHNFSKRSIILW